MPSFTIARAVLQKPYLDPSTLPFPSVKARFALICGQMLIYHERFSPTHAQLTLYHAAVNAGADSLESGYRRQVLAEFVAAAKAVEGAHGSEGAAAGNNAAGARDRHATASPVPASEIGAATRLESSKVGAKRARANERAAANGAVGQRQTASQTDKAGARACAQPTVKAAADGEDGEDDSDDVGDGGSEEGDLMDAVRLCALCCGRYSRA